MKIAFILGKNPTLSIAEIQAVLGDARVAAQSTTFLIVETKGEVDCAAVLHRLGGTIKVGEVVDSVITAEIISDEILKHLPERLTSFSRAGVQDDNIPVIPAAEPESHEIPKQVRDDNKKKIKFGVSFYESKPTKIGFEVKKKLKEAGHNARLVTSKENALSSVIVQKEKVDEFMVLKNTWLARTLAVQEFEEYGSRDFGRPARDSRSGMLPPKLAKIMINLSQQPLAATLLDPFCGSGTIVTEALLMGYENVIGSDNSAQAIIDSKTNLEWISSTYKLPATTYKLLQSDVRQISSKVKIADAIVTEPFLGPPLRGAETNQQIEKIISDLSPLYLDALSQFEKILKPGGRVVMVFPWYTKLKKTLPILERLASQSWKRLDSGELFYSRPEQHVWRQIVILEKK